jgi:predicted RND superfamily exporter protein
MIGRFGLWVAVGAIVEWAIVFGVLPPLFRAFPRLGELPSRSLSPISQWLIPKKLAWILLALPFLALVLAPPLRAHVDPFELFSKDHPLRVDAEKHRATEKVLAVSRADLSLDEWKQSLEEMKVQPGVQYVVSSESVLGLWISEVDAQDQGLVAWLRRQWVGSGIADRFESESGLHRAYAEVRSGDLESLKLWAESQSRLQLTNDYWVYNEFAANVIQTLKDSTWLALFLVGALISVMAVVMRQWRAIPRLLLCAVWGPVSMLALCRWLEIPVTVNLAPFAAVLMGLSGDNAIQFLYFSRKEAGFLAASQNWGRASVEVSVFMFVLAAIPMFSAFAPATTLALFLMGGVLLALIGELYIFKSLETDS